MIASNTLLILRVVHFVMFLASGFIIKKSIIKVIEEVDSLKATQIKNLASIVNTTYYTEVTIIVLSLLSPFIIQLIRY